MERLAVPDNAEWMQFSTQLAARAYAALLHLQIPNGKAASEAVDFAQEACERIFVSPFPYDVSFDAWASRILKNCILQRYTRSRDLTDRNPGVMSLDQPEQSAESDQFSLHELVASAPGASAFDHVEVREWLMQAIACLPSPAQQQVIIDTFFHELDDEEIARRLDKTKNAIQVLRHRALRTLRQSLKQ